MVKYRLHRKVASVVVILLSAALLISAWAFYMSFAMQESLYFDRGSFPYYALLDGEIKNMPTPGRIGDRKFFYSAGDGGKPPMDAVEFKSEHSRDKIISRVTSYLTDLGYETKNHSKLIKGDIEYNISFGEKVGNLRHIQITRFETL